MRGVLKAAIYVSAEGHCKSVEGDWESKRFRKNLQAFLGRFSLRLDEFLDETSVKSRLVDVARVYGKRDGF